MTKKTEEMAGLPPEKRCPFSCTRYDPIPPGGAENLIDLVKSEVRSSSRYELEILEEIMRFLANHSGHNFEGRATESGAKTSFSQSEVAAALSLPEPRRIEYLVYRFKFAVYPRDKIAGSFPIIVAIEPTSLCNLRCTMCFQADTAYFARDNSLMGQMDFGLYREIVDEMAENGPCGLVLASRGEPMLHPRFTEMVGYATKRGIIDTKLNTNATALTEKKCRELLEAEPNTVVFSVDAGNKKEFETIRVGANFEKVVANIRRFHNVREKEFPNSRTRTRISMTVFRESQDPQEAEKLWAPLVDEFAINAVDYRLDIYDHPPLPQETKPCGVLWERVYVWWNGMVNPCDIDYKSHLDLGRVGGGVTLKSIWQGEKMWTMRENHSAGNKNRHFPCNQCYGV